MSTASATPSNAADERTPLLATEPAIQPAPAAIIQDADDDEQALPRGQMTVLFFCRMVEPIAFFSIFPFISQMVKETGSLDERDVGFYSGLIESLFSLTQMLLMIAWGKASDRFGRRPILIFSFLGIGTGSAIFGFSTTVWQMIVCRCFTGLFAGSAVTVRALVSENSTPKTQARAFSFYAVAGNLGIFLGPLIGGSLADPAHSYPRLFGSSDFFRKFPFALSTMVAGGFSLAAAVICIFFLKETVNKTAGKAQKSMGTMELVRSPGVSMVLFMYVYNIMLGFAFTAIAPVFWFTSPSLGGLGLSPLGISTFLAVGGLSQALWTLLLFPPWQKRVGTGGVLRFLYYSYPLMLLGNIVPAILRRTGHEVSFYVVGIVWQVLGASIAMTYTGVQLALNDISPSHHVLGQLNAVCLSLTSGNRSFAPALFASLYAFGVREQIIWGYFAWVLLAAMSAILPVVLAYVPDKALGRGPQAKRTETDDDDTEEGAP